MSWAVPGDALILSVALRGDRDGERVRAPAQDHEQGYEQEHSGSTGNGQPQAPKPSRDAIASLLDQYEAAAIEHGAGKTRGLHLTLIRGQIDRTLRAHQTRLRRIAAAAELVSDAWGDIPFGCRAFEQIIEELRAALTATATNELRTQTGQYNAPVPESTGDVGSPSRSGGAR